MYGGVRDNSWKVVEVGACVASSPKSQILPKAVVHSDVSIASTGGGHRTHRHAPWLHHYVPGFTAVYITHLGPRSERVESQSLPSEESEKFCPLTVASYRLIAWSAQHLYTTLNVMIWTAPTALLFRKIRDPCVPAPPALQFPNADAPQMCRFAVAPLFFLLRVVPVPLALVDLWTCGLVDLWNSLHLQDSC